jgi:hypothetical protein
MTAGATARDSGVIGRVRLPDFGPQLVRVLDKMTAPMGVADAG